MIGKYFRWKSVLKPKRGYSSCFVGLQYFSKSKGCKLPGFLSDIPRALIRSNVFVWGCEATSLEPSGGQWLQGYSRQEEKELPQFPFCPLMCLLITALMKYLQLIMIWYNWNSFRKDKWNCYYWWMLCDSGEIGIAVWASDGSYYIGWIISVIAAFWFVVPESCLISVCEELYLSAVTAQILVVVHALLNLVSIFSNCHLGILCLSHGRLSAGRMSGPCWISLGATVHPLLCTQPCLHQKLLSSALTYLTFSLYRHNPAPGLTKGANISSCQKAALIFSGYLSLFSFSGVIGGIWSWFREGFVPSCFCDSGIWEERKACDPWRSVRL